MHMAINKPDYNMRNRKYMLRYFELPLKKHLIHVENLSMINQSQLNDPLSSLSN